MPETKQVIYVLVGVCRDGPNEFNQTEEILASQSRMADAVRIMCEEIQDCRFWERFGSVEIRRQEVLVRRTGPFGASGNRSGSGASAYPTLARGQTLHR